MGVGERIRHYRKAAGYTQKTLAEAVGLTESAIRNYELGLRMPSRAQLEAIARELCVMPESLVDSGLMGPRGALEFLFRLESEMGFKPVETENGMGIAVDPKAEDSQGFCDALRAWSRMRVDFESGRVSEAEYESWKASFKG